MVRAAGDRSPGVTSWLRIKITMRAVRAREAAHRVGPARHAVAVAHALARALQHAVREAGGQVEHALRIAHERVAARRLRRSARVERVLAASAETAAAPLGLQQRAASQLLHHRDTVTAGAVMIKDECARAQPIGAARRPRARVEPRAIALHARALLGRRVALAASRARANLRARPSALRRSRSGCTRSRARRCARARRLSESVCALPSLLRVAERCARSARDRARRAARRPRAWPAAASGELEAVGILLDLAGHARARCRARSAGACRATAWRSLPTRPRSRRSRSRAASRSAPWLPLGPVLLGVVDRQHAPAHRFFQRVDQALEPHVRRRAAPG